MIKSKNTLNKGKRNGINKSKINNNETHIKTLDSKNLK